MPILAVNAHRMKSAYLQKLLTSPLHCGVNVQRYREWEPRPSVPKSFEETMRQFGEQYGVKLRLEWDGFGRFFIIMQKAKEWDFDEEKYVEKDGHVFDLVTPDGRPIKAADFGTYIFDVISEFHMGFTAKAKREYRKRLKEAQDSIKRDENEKIMEEGLEVAEQAARSAHDGESYEKMIGRDKVHSMGANSAADSSKGAAATKRRSKRAKK